MKFLNLEIENFLVLTEAKISLKDRGLLLIQGENHADSSAMSNGAGKSSIADALCWALYGVTARGETGDQIINNKAGKNTRVEVLIDDDGMTYRIVRHRKHKTGKNNVHIFVSDGLTGEKDLTKGTDKLTQETIEKIIGASLEVFTGSIYAGQEKMPDLPSMTDKMLKVLIEEAAGINALEAAYVRARDNARIAKSDLELSEQNRAAIEAQRAGVMAQRDAAVIDDQTWAASRDAQMKVMADTVRNSVMPEIQRLASEAPAAEIDRLTAEIQAIDARIASVGSEQITRQTLAQTLGTVQMRVSRCELEQRRFAQAAQDAQKRRDAAGHKVGCPCDSCGRPLSTAELGALIDAADRELTLALANENNVTADLTVARAALEDAQSALAVFERGMTDVSAEVAQRASLEAQRAVLLQKDRQRQALTDQARSDIEKINRLKAETSPFVAVISRAQSAIDDLDKRLANVSGEIAVRKERAEIEQEVVRVFSPAGVRARVLDEVTPYLNGQTGKYLSILSDGNISAEWSTLTVNKFGEVKEKFAIDVSSPISSRTFKGLSGGEKRKVRVATALALQDLVSTRAAKPIDLFVGDEIDDALDASGLERLMIILEEKAKERGTVMVISHNSLKDEIRNVLTVERTAAGETKLTETHS